MNVIKLDCGSADCYVVTPYTELVDILNAHREVADYFDGEDRENLELERR